MGQSVLRDRRTPSVNLRTPDKSTGAEHSPF
uniref:Uncharacterized protein n=1 Tax=Anguilla anguilla TaxID=7936 RepID=A0A0E9R918_ANGAN